MSARHLVFRGPAPAGADVDLLDVVRPAISSLADWLGLGWGLVLRLVVPTAVVLAAGVALTVWLWRRTSKTPSSIGSDLFPGRVVTVASAEGTHGQAFVEGSWWSVRSTGAPLRPGEEVRVRAVDGLDLVVEQLGADAPDDEEDP